MNELFLISIGDIQNESLSEILNHLEKTGEDFRVPFVRASEESEWNDWKKREHPAFTGVGVGAAGCTLAHRKAWAAFLESGLEIALIIESDAKLTRYGLKYLKKAISTFIESDLNLLHLGSHEKLGFTLRNFMQASLRGLAKGIYENWLLFGIRPKIARSQFPFSTHAYLLKYNSAKELNSLALNLLVPIDVLLNAVAQVPENKIGRVRTPIIVQDQSQTSQTRLLGR
jgi:GR25 family glycosyltransferase involved in LPS biosynthesis